MSRYIAHTRRKLKRKVEHPASLGADSKGDRLRGMDAQRQADRAALEKARSEKEMRAEMRRLRKTEPAEEPSGRRRTAARAAGLALISATAGLRTLRITLNRLPGRSSSDLWGADVSFQIARGFTHYVNDPFVPADIDALHAMRALAPRIAEELLLGSTNVTGDEKNLHTAQCLAESYMRKKYNTCSLTNDDMRRLCDSIVLDFHNVTASRLSCLRAVLNQIIEALMHTTKLPRAQCDTLLAKVYAGFEQYYEHRPAPQLFRPPRNPKAHDAASRG